MIFVRIRFEKLQGRNVYCYMFAHLLYHFRKLYFCSPLTLTAPTLLTACRCRLCLQLIALDSAYRLSHHDPWIQDFWIQEPWIQDTCIQNPGSRIAGSKTPGSWIRGSRPLENSWIQDPWFQDPWIQDPWIAAKSYPYRYRFP